MNDYVLNYLLQTIFALSQQGDQLRARVAELEARERAQAADADAQEASVGANPVTSTRASIEPH